MKPENSDLNPPDEPKPPPMTSSSSTGRPRELTSEDLLGGQQEVCIRHGDETYRLRLTRNGKLILHK